MRKITIDAIDSFMNAQKFKRANTEVEVLQNVTILSLFGNRIAYRYNDPDQTLAICTDYLSKTTSERLNALPGVYLQRKNWVWYLNGCKWDGSFTEIKQEKGI